MDKWQVAKIENDTWLIYDIVLVTDCLRCVSGDLHVHVRGGQVTLPVTLGMVCLCLHGQLSPGKNQAVDSVGAHRVHPEAESLSHRLKVEPLRHHCHHHLLGSLCHTALRHYESTKCARNPLYGCDLLVHPDPEVARRQQVLWPLRDDDCKNGRPDALLCCSPSCGPYGFWGLSTSHTFSKRRTRYLNSIKSFW